MSDLKILSTLIFVGVAFVGLSLIAGWAIQKMREPSSAVLGRDFIFKNNTFYQGGLTEARGDRNGNVWVSINWSRDQVEEFRAACVADRKDCKP